jgi:hypothetical protein
VPVIKQARDCLPAVGPAKVIASALCADSLAGFLRQSFDVVSSCHFELLD